MKEIDILFKKYQIAKALENEINRMGSLILTFQHALTDNQNIYFHFSALQKYSESLSPYSFYWSIGNEESDSEKCNGSAAISLLSFLKDHISEKKSERLNEIMEGIKHISAKGFKISDNNILEELSQKNFTLKDIDECICEYFQIPSIKEKSRKSKVVKARKLFYVIATDLNVETRLQKLGVYLRQDHATVLHAKRDFANILYWEERTSKYNYKKDYENLIGTLERKVEGKNLSLEKLKSYAALDSLTESEKVKAIAIIKELSISIIRAVHETVKKEWKVEEKELCLYKPAA